MKGNFALTSFNQSLCDGDASLSPQDPSYPFPQRNSRAGILYGSKPRRVQDIATTDQPYRQGDHTAGPPNQDTGLTVTVKLKVISNLCQKNMSKQVLPQVNQDARSLCSPESLIAPAFTLKVSPFWTIDYSGFSQFFSPKTALPY